MSVKAHVSLCNSYLYYQTRSKFCKFVNCIFASTTSVYAFPNFISKCMRHFWTYSGNNNSKNVKIFLNDKFRFLKLTFKFFCWFMYRIHWNVMLWNTKVLLQVLKNLFYTRECCGVHSGKPWPNLEWLNLERPNLERLNVERPNLERLNIEKDRTSKDWTSNGTEHRKGHIIVY